MVSGTNVQVEGVGEAPGPNTAIDTINEDILVKPGKLGVAGFNYT